jgi:retinol-binding protein 3
MAERDHSGRGDDGMIRATLSAAFILLAALPAAVPAAGLPASVAASVQEARSEAILALLRAHYVKPRDVKRAEAAIRQLGSRHAGLDDDDYARNVGPALSKLLHDRHLLLEYRARPIRDKPELPQSAEVELATKARREEFARRVNYGFSNVVVLDNDIGYLRIDGFMPPEVAGPALAAAMTTLHGTGGLVIDLRESVNGGDPRMVALVCAYLIPEAGRLLTTIAWRHKQPDHSRIPAVARGAAYPRTSPVYVLTSRRTFSAGEELAYNLKVLKRARVIGEPTGGGANPGSEYKVGDHLALFIPEGTAINAETGTNWNWTGVIPDEAIAPSSALERAMELLAVRRNAAAAKEDES